MSAPPELNFIGLQGALDSLMKRYEALDQERSQKSCIGCGALALLGIGGMSLEPMLPEPTGDLMLPLAFLGGGLYAAIVVILFWSSRGRRLAALDADLHELASQIPGNDRLHLSLDDRTRLHNRLFDCRQETLLAIIRLLEVAGNKESLHYLNSLAGTGFYAALLASRVTPTTRQNAIEAAANLKAKLDREKDAATLLRSSGAVTENELLRPAANAGTPAEQLLRAEIADNTDDG